MLYTIPSFCANWHEVERAPKNVQEKYVISELQKLDEYRQPILSTVLACLDDWVQMMALRILNNHEEPIFSDGEVRATYMLRLREDIKPEELPLFDQQGRRLPSGKAGKVLVAKLGNRGGKYKPTGDGSESYLATAQFDSTFRLQAAQSMAPGAGADLYDVVEIGKKPKVVSIRAATIVLKTWGVGVSRQRFRPHRMGKFVLGRADADYKYIENPSLGQDKWLVEELHAGGPPLDMDTPVDE